MMRKRSDFRILCDLLFLMKDLWIYMVVAIAFGVVGHLLAIMIPASGMGLILFQDKRFLWVLIFAGIFRGVFRYVEQLFNHELAFRVLAEIRDVVFGKLRTLAPAKLENKERGNLISLITSDIEHLEVFYAHTISPIFIALIVNGLILFLIFKIHLIFGFISLLSFVILGLIIPIYFSRTGQSVGLNYRNELGSLNSFVLESVSGIQDILQYQLEQKRLKHMHLKTDSLNMTQMKMTDFGIINQSISEVVVMGSILLFLSVGLYLDVDVSLMIFGLVLHASSFGPVLALSNLANNMYHTLASGERTLNLLDEEPEVCDVIDGVDIVFNELQVKNVDFGYDEKMILKEINLSLNKNEILAISGDSGSGKSTLLKLLMRFWDVDSGSITYNGINISEVTTNSLRATQGVIMQETDVFQDTIYNNICLGKDIGLEEVIEACKMAGIHDFITSLEKGYDTHLAEFGSSISSGEKQRIGLARMFLHNSDLIILDEPTSNLDSLNEAIVLKSLMDFRHKQPIIITSHRASTLRIADRELSMKNGSLHS